MMTLRIARRKSMNHLDTSTTYDQEQFQQFYTDSQEIKSLMLQLLGNVHQQALLEPCAGKGAFLSGLVGEPSSVDAIDIDPGHVTFLKNNFPSYVNAINADFIDLFISGSLFHSPGLKSVYDSIICNPPYGLRFSIEYRKKIKKLYPDFYARESYGLFMFLGISLLRYRGRYVFIVPDTFLTSHYHTSLREFLLREGHITHLIRFKSHRFKTVNFGYGGLCIIAGYRQPVESHHDIFWVDLIDSNDPLSYDTLVHSIPTKGHYLLKHCTDGWVHSSQKTPIQLPTLTSVLGDIAECRTGIYTGDNARFCGYDSRMTHVRGNGHPIDWEIQVHTEQLTKEEQVSGIEGIRSYVPLIKGGHREPFSSTSWAINWSKNAVAFYANDKKARLQNVKFYFKKGLAIPMVTSGRISASLMEGAIFDQGVVGVFPYKEELSNFLLLYLNSKFVTITVKRAINPSANNSANYIKKIPLPIPTHDNLDKAEVITKQSIAEGWSNTRTLREEFIESLIYHK